MPFLVSLAWRDLRTSGRTLWVFCLCLMLGVTLIAATGGLYRQVSAGLMADTRSLFGGDLEVESRAPLPPEVLAWMNARGRVSLLIELRTMLATEDDRFHLVELQSVDRHYPLYGELALEPPQDPAVATGLRDGTWGVALDPLLAQRLELKVGDKVQLGELTLAVRALIKRQPDRRLSADWRGPPVLIAAPALAASELVQPGSRLDYEYRVRTDQNPDEWRDAFHGAFPESDWEVRSFTHRSQRLARVLGQVTSGLLLIGFSALFIGGLGVFNSIQAYLQGKLATLATLRTLGLRDRRLAGVYLLQVAILGSGASLAGMLLGGALAVTGASLAARRLPLSGSFLDLLPALASAGAFGLLTAFTFALPAIGRALSVQPTVLFRGVQGSLTQTPARYWVATALSALLVAALVLLTLPDPLFGVGFILVLGLLIALLEALVRGLRRLARGLEQNPLLEGRFPLRLALANLHRPGSPLRSTLLSLGSALTLLVACTLVVVALLRAINETVPEEAPALVFYDIAAHQREAVTQSLAAFDSLERLELAPLVLGRLAAVNGEHLRDSEDPRRAREARDEHKLSYRAANIDGVKLIAGQWWPEEAADGTKTPPRVAMEDREAQQLGLKPGDRLGFVIEGQPVEAELAAIYSQRGMQTRFWFEAIFSPGALNPFITRYVGAAYMSDTQALAAQNQVAALAPNVIIVRTEAILAEARALLGKAAAGLATVAAISLAASLLVLSSVIATGRARLVYEATLLHTLGTRLGVIRRSLQLEYLLLGLITSLFAVAGGMALALPLLTYRLGLATDGLLFAALATALLVSTFTLAAGGYYLLRQLRLSPATLLRSGP